MFGEMSDGELETWVRGEGLQLVAEKVAATQGGTSAEVVLEGLRLLCTERVVEDFILSQCTSGSGNPDHAAVRLLYCLSSDGIPSPGVVPKASKRGGGRKRQ